MISIKKYNHKMKNIWDDFVNQSNNGTLFHKQSFLNYHLDRKFKNHSLLFYKENNLICVLPGAIITKNKKKVFHSHPGASFGGFVFLQNITFKLTEKILCALDKHLMQLQINSIILILSPAVYYKHFDESLNYLLVFKKYNIIENYISHYTNLLSVKNLYDIISKRKTRYIKKLISDESVEIVKSKNFKAFYQILEISKKKYNTLPTHSLKELIKLHKMFPENIELLISKKKNKIVGGTLLFYPNSQTCLVFYNVVNKSFPGGQLASLQLYNVMTYAKNNNCNIVDFGVSHLPETLLPLNPKFSLIKFKEQFGAKGCLRIVYEKDLNCE